MSTSEQPDLKRASIAQRLEFEKVAECLCCGGGLAESAHLNSADKFLGQIPGEFDFVRKSGLETPNAEATGLSLFGRYWRGLEVPRHLSIATRTGLDAALKAAGFAKPEYHVRGSIRQWLWQESLDAMPEVEHGTAIQAMASAPTETAANCEFLTVTARAGAD